MLGLEDTGSRMTRIAKSELVYESLMPVDEVLARVEAVTLDDVRAVVADVLDAPQALAVIGPVRTASAVNRPARRVGPTA